VTIDPAALGHGHASLEGLQVDTAEASANLIRAVFDGAEDEASVRARSMIALNAGAGIYAAGRADTLEAGVARAEAVMASGGAAEKLAAFVAFTQTVSELDAGAPGA
jgi:anthranilate phosphoribosyltransferase